VTTYPAILRSRFRNANLPLMMAGVYLDQVADELTRQEPSGAIEKFVQLMKDGKCLRAAGHHKSCGKGLWISGKESTLVAAAVLQQLLLDQDIESALIVDAYEYADSLRPGKDDQYASRVYSDLVVLSGASRLRKSVSDWAPELVYQLTRERYWRGLPTIIADTELLSDNAELVYPGALLPVRIGST
jgi:hypothetical protein